MSKFVDGELDQAPPKEAKADWLKAMAAKLESTQGRALYKLPQQAVAPDFGIVKAVLGFTEFSLRGPDKVAGEWDLVALAYNCKRRHKLKAATRAATTTHRRLSSRLPPVIDNSAENHATQNLAPQVRQTARSRDSDGPQIRAGSPPVNSTKHSPRAAGPKIVVRSRVGGDDTQ